MTSLTQFNIPFTDNLAIKGEYEGNEDAKRLVIFSHGFGVKRDSWGMFNEIGDALKDRSIVVRFDYNRISIEENATHVLPCSVQSRMLAQVIDHFTTLFSPTSKAIIAHSMGCVVVGMLQPTKIEKILLLSPPILPPYQRVKEKFAQRPRSHFNENRQSILERSDGSWTYIPPEFWSEIKTIKPQELYNDLFAQTKLFAIKPLQDQVIIDEDYSDLKRLLDKKYVEIDGSHDFHPPHRQKLLDTIQKILGEK